MMPPEPKPLEDRIPDAYRELREVAERLLRRERCDHTLQPTALVHEVYVRLSRDRSQADLESIELLNAAASIMRRVLVDHARKRAAAKRGGPLKTRRPLDETLLLYEERAVDLLTLNEALERMERLDPELSNIVELRFFGGLNEEETALSLGKSTRSIRRAWKTARLWLLQELLDGE